MLELHYLLVAGICGSGRLVRCYAYVEMVLLENEVVSAIIVVTHSHSYNIFTDEQMLSFVEVVPSYYFLVAIRVTFAASLIKIWGPIMLYTIL